MRNALPLLLLAACGVEPAVNTSAQALDDCTSIAPTGADQRLALQASLDAEPCAQLEEGTYVISNDPAAGITHIAGLTLRAGRTLRGRGPGTVLRFVGAGANGDWWGILVLGSGVTIEGLTVEFGGTDTVEQTHAIQIGHPARGEGPVTGTRIRDLEMWWSRATPTSRMGDCVRLSGEAGAETIDTEVERVSFNDCPRSGVGVQRQVHGLKVVRNVFANCGTDVDLEATGAASAVSGAIEIAYNDHRLGAGAQGPHGIHVTAEGSAYDVRVHDSDLGQRGVVAYNAEVTIERVTARLSVATTSPLAWANKRSTMIVRDSHLERAASAGPGAVVAANHHGTGVPILLEVTGSTLVQLAAGAAVLASSAEEVRVERTWIQGGLAGWYAIDVNGGISRTRLLAAIGNEVTGSWTASVRASGSYAGIAEVAWERNRTSGPAYGLYCPAGAGGVGTATSRGNVGPAPLACPLAPVAPTN